MRGCTAGQANAAAAAAATTIGIDGESCRQIQVSLIADVIPEALRLNFFPSPVQKNYLTGRAFGRRKKKCHNALAQLADCITSTETTPQTVHVTTQPSSVSVPTGVAALEAPSAATPASPNRSRKVAPLSLGPVTHQPSAPTAPETVSAIVDAQHTTQQFAPRQAQLQQIQPRPSSADAGPPPSPSGAIPWTGPTYANGYKDGRVKDPVPSNLRGKANPQGGSFSVMHIDINTAEAKRRDEIAKRTSERTERAAKMAHMAGYTSFSRRRLDEAPNSPAANLSSSSLSMTSTATPNAQTGGPRQTSLDPKQTKEEQARLLTLLRTLNPVSVVDQLCKGLAYFGGIPGAPPPEDGVFPESAEKNGSGNQFVGFIAEIFPHQISNQALNMSPTRSYTLLQDTVDEASMPPKNMSASPPKEPGKRPRGRPKGSKATKVRKDKGMRKVLAKAPGASGAPMDPTTSVDVDSSWVDVEENVGHTPGGHGVPGHMAPTGDQQSSVPKKRGRPKGSKNRPKERTGDPNANGDMGTPNSKMKKPKKQKNGAVDDGEPFDMNDHHQGNTAESAMTAMRSLHHTNSMATTSLTATNQPNSTTYMSPPAHTVGTPTGSKRKRNPMIASNPDGNGPETAGPVMGGMPHSSMANGQLPPPVAIAQPPNKRQRQSRDENNISGTPGNASGAPADSTLPVVGDAVVGDDGFENRISTVTNDDIETFEALQSQLEQETERSRVQNHSPHGQVPLSQSRGPNHYENSNHSIPLGTQHGSTHVSEAESRTNGPTQQFQQQQQQQQQPPPPQQHHTQQPRQLSVSSQPQQQAPMQPRSSSQPYYAQVDSNSSYSQQPQQSRPQTQQQQPSSQQFPTQSQPQAPQHYNSQQSRQQQPYNSYQHSPQTYTAPQQTTSRYPLSQQQSQQQQRHQPQRLTTNPAVNDTAYRPSSNTSAVGFSSPSFGSQHGSQQASAAPSVNTYAPTRTNSYSSTPMRQRQSQPGPVSHNNMSANMESFHGFDTGTNSLFDNMGLDPSSHAPLGLAAPYNLNSGGGVARSSSGSTTDFGQNFPADRYYNGIRR